MKFSFLFFFVLLPFCLRAQSDDCPFYDTYLNLGDAKFAQDSFEVAIDKYSIAMLHCPDRAEEARKRIKAVFKAIEKLKMKAEDNEKKIRITLEKLKDAQILTDTALAQLNREQKNTEDALHTSDSLRFVAMNSDSLTKIALDSAKESDSLTTEALKKAQNLIDAFYFYADSFALAYKNDKFYFIDRNGNEVRKLHKWDKAEQFDWMGLAKVKDDVPATDYLMDTTGNTYRVAYNIQDLNNSITALDLSGKRLTEIPDEVFKNKQLEVLILGSNEISKVSSKIGSLPNLKILDLSGTKIGFLPSEIGRLNKLTNLYLGGIYIGAHDGFSPGYEIYELDSLKILDLGGLELYSVPNNIGNLKQLVSLDLSGNELNEIPDTILQLKKLKILGLSVNNLDSLPDILGELTSLTSLDLSGNQLNKLPKSLWELENLTSLNLSGNNLDSLPEKIGELTNLTSLDLSGNNLDRLSESIWKLEKLTLLDLSSNKLDSLPFNIKNLKNLRYLGLSNNYLSELPIQQIKELKYLNTLDLNGGNVFHDLELMKIYVSLAPIIEADNMSDVFIRLESAGYLYWEDGEIHFDPSPPVENEESDSDLGEDTVLSEPVIEYHLLIGSLQNPSDAENRRNELLNLGYSNTEIVEGEEGTPGILIQRYATLAEAEQAKKELLEKHSIEAKVEMVKSQ